MEKNDKFYGETMPNITTTLGVIKSHNPCKSGWKKLCKTLGTTDPETEVTLSQVLESNGVQDAFWVLRCWDYRDWCLLIADVIDIPAIRNHRCAAVSDMPDTIRRWHSGVITYALLSAAEVEAREAARTAWAEWAAWAELAARAARVEWAARGTAWAARGAEWAALGAALGAAWTARGAAWERNEKLMREFCYNC